SRWSARNLSARSRTNIHGRTASASSIATASSASWNWVIGSLGNRVICGSIGVMVKRSLTGVLLYAALSAAMGADANHPTGTRGLLLIDKLGATIRFLDPLTYKERSAFKVATNPHDFALSPDGKTAYVPLYGDGVYGRNPNPGHEVVI